jgi:hypothetical protein
MSYLDWPRLNFAGKFLADPSTINNATENYDPNEVYNNNPPSPINPNSVWWNPQGQHFFKFLPGSAVTSAVDTDGNLTTTDPVVGASLISVVSGTPDSPGNVQWGRLVDLDPDQQAVSMVIGLALQLTLPGATSPSLTGIVRGMCILDIWGRVQGGSGGGIESAGCIYQSVLENLQWNNVEGSSVLATLYAASPDMLSIKMTVDAYNGDITDTANFSQGRVVGALGPYTAGEPVHSVAKRRMFASLIQNSAMNDASFQVSGSSLEVDLANSVPTTGVHAAPFKDIFPLNIVINPGQNQTEITTPLVDSLETYTDAYGTTSAIFNLPLTAQELAALQTSPVGLISTTPPGTTSAVTGIAAGRLKENLTLAQSGANPQPLSAGPTLSLSERSDGLYVQASLNAVRLEKGAPPWSEAAESSTEITSSSPIVFTATKWGAPAPGVTIAVTTVTNLYQFPDADGNPKVINNDPMSAISWSPQSGTTDDTGQLSF